LFQYWLKQFLVGFLDPSPEELEVVGQDFENGKSGTLIIYDSAGIDRELTASQYRMIFGYMGVDFSEWDVASRDEIDFSRFHTVVLAFIEFEKADYFLPDLMDWLDQGGRLPGW